MVLKFPLIFLVKLPERRPWTKNAKVTEQNRNPRRACRAQIASAVLPGFLFVFWGRPATPLLRQYVGQGRSPTQSEVVHPALACLTSLGHARYWGGALLAHLGLDRQDALLHRYVHAPKCRRQAAVPTLFDLGSSVAHPGANGEAWNLPYLAPEAQRVVIGYMPGLPMTENAFQPMMGSTGQWSSCALAGV